LQRTVTHHQEKDMNATSNRTRTLGLMLGFAGTLGLALSAHAGVQRPSAGQKSAVVRYDDLSLDSAAGVKTLYARLSIAADQVCGSAPGRVELRQVMAFRSCHASALNDAVAKIGNRNLQALHRASTDSSAVG
jgi:UrcA family protein